MTWFKVDDKSHSHPKVVQAGNAAWGLYVQCGAWCADQLTDGKIPKKIAKLFGKPSEIRALVAAGLWVDNGTEFVIPDYLEFNPSRQRVEGERASARDRMSRRRSGEQEPNTDPNFGTSSASPTRTRTYNSKETPQHQDSSEPTAGGVDVEALRNQVVLAAAELHYAQQDSRQIANPAGWMHTVAQRLLRSHGHEIDRALEMGLAVSAIADRIVNPNASDAARAQRAESARNYGIAVAEQQHAGDLVDRAAFADEVARWDDDDRASAMKAYDERVASLSGANVVTMRRSNV